MSSPTPRVADIERRIQLRRAGDAPRLGFGPRVPRIASSLTSVVALVNLASAVTPSLADRLALVRMFAPLDELRVAHVAALPVAGALLIAAHQLGRGSRRAVHVAIALLGLATVLNLAKGLDVEEAALSFAAAALLWRFRRDFAMTARALPRREHPRDPAERAAAAAVCRTHGAGTLGAFALRSDLSRIWAADGRAFAAYRVEAGALVLAGDPVGDRASYGAVLDEALALASEYGLALGAVGVSDDFAELARRRGLRRLYVGEEALIPTGTVDLVGRAHKGLRTTLNRVVRHGYVASMHRVGELDRPTLTELERISELWRDGSDERGFSMGHDCLADDLLPDALVVVARDESGVVRGFLHFMPVFGQPQVSLAFMRRDRDTPNGLIEFLVIRSCELLSAEGVDELSLNFAPFAGLRRNPRNAGERTVVRMLLAIDQFFHAGGLEGFNAKFNPRWERRHILFSRPSDLPRVIIAAMVCEGLLPGWPGSSAELPDRQPVAAAA